MQGDSKKAVAFLALFHPRGPWVLTAINPNRKGIETKTFGPDSVDECVTWLDGHNGKWNCYFSVNPTIKPVSKKAERTDIKSVDYLHVDVDPRAGEDLIEEQARARALCLEKLPDGIPEPTFVIFSGGGYQAFWKLSEPIEINGDLDKAEDAKLWNLQLERVFGADNVHNIDRIMRLVGTVNVPDAKKRKKGRKKALATLESATGTEYGFDAFTKAQAIQMPEAGLGGTGQGITVEVSGNIARLNSVEDLKEWDVPDRVCALVVQGIDPDKPKAGDNSRSAWLFDVVCNLVRCEVPDDVIYSTITDPDFLISESVLDKGARAERYAMRTIARAKEEAIEPALRELNERHAVIENWGGKCVVMEEVADEVFPNRPRLTKQSFGEIKNRYCNRKVQAGTTAKGNPIYVPLGKWWLEHANRKTYHKVVFYPGAEIPRAYNLWQGFACEAKPGDCNLFLEHVKENICNGDEGHYKYLMGWMARAVQQPASPGLIAVVLRGGQGSGKSFFANMFGNLFGRHFLTVSNSAHLVGNFNSHLRDCSVIFADEAFFAGDKRHESVLKTLITESTIAIEAKGVDLEVSPNFTHVIMASNHDWVIPAGQGERRYFVLDVNEQKKLDSIWFKSIKDQLDSGGQEALLHTLMTWDINDFNVRDVPKTKALGDQKLHTLDPLEQWWFECLQEGQMGNKVWKDAEWIPKSDIRDDYIEQSKDAGIHRRGSPTEMGMFLSKITPDEGYPRTKRLICKRLHVGDDGYQIEVAKRESHYQFPSLTKCRKHWEKTFSAEIKWPPAPEGTDDQDPEIPF